MFNRLSGDGPIGTAADSRFTPGPRLPRRTAPLDITVRPMPFDKWLGLLIFNTIKDLTSQLTGERLPLPSP
jgi:hypothetical protein